MRLQRQQLQRLTLLRCQQASSHDPGFDLHDVSVVSFELPASFTIVRVRSFALQVLDNALTVVSGRPSGFANMGPFMPSDAMWTTARALAGIGVFSVFAYTVEQRTSEMGIRLALGARPAQVVWTLLASSSRPLAAGLAFGVAGAVVAGLVLRRFLNGGLSPFDPIAYAEVAALLAIVAVAATVVPARRATRIDPIAALRCE